MTTPITQLPTPPRPSDTPADFDSKAFSLLGALPGFVTQVNQFGVEVTAIGDAANENAQAAEAAKSAAQVSASAAASSESSASTSKDQAATSESAANQSKLDAQAAASKAETISTGMESAIALANTFTSVPATNQGPMIVVTQPHLRFMVWNGLKYVRAPWHRPGILFHSDGPVANITHAIQVRSDVVYNTADHPDLAEFYGFSGSTFVLKDARARVLRGADMGKGTDVAMVNGYLQEDAIRNITGTLTDIAHGASVLGGGTGSFRRDSGGNVGNGTGTGSTDNFSFDASRIVPTASENRVKSLIGVIYVTR